jgi:hypothetical protein
MSVTFESVRVVRVSSMQVYCFLNACVPNNWKIDGDLIIDGDGILCHSSRNQHITSNFELNHPHFSSGCISPDARRTNGYYN